MSTLCAMKVYGRRAHSYDYDTSHDIEFSDDEMTPVRSDLSMEPKSESSISSASNKQAKVFSNAAGQRSDNKLDLQGDSFDDLFNNIELPKRKKRKTTYRKKIEINQSNNVLDGENFDGGPASDNNLEFETSIQDISDYLDQIKSDDDRKRTNALEDIDSLYESHQVSISSLQNTKLSATKSELPMNRYLGNATVVHRQVSLYDSLDSDSKQVDGNKFKAMRKQGHALQYQDDVDELLLPLKAVTVETSAESFVLAIIKLVINMFTDSDLKDFIIQNYSDNLINTLDKFSFKTDTVFKPLSQMLLSDLVTCLVDGDSKIGDSMVFKIANVIKFNIIDLNHIDFKVEIAEIGRKYPQLSSSVNAYSAIIDHHDKNISAFVKLIVQFPSSLNFFDECSLKSIFTNIIKYYESEANPIKNDIEDVLLKGLILLVNSGINFAGNSKKDKSFFIDMLEHIIDDIENENDLDDIHLLKAVLSCNLLINDPIIESCDLKEKIERLLCKILCEESERKIVEDNLMVFQYLSLVYLLSGSKISSDKLALTLEQTKRLKLRFTKLLSSLHVENVKIQNKINDCMLSMDLIK